MKEFRLANLLLFLGGSSKNDDADGEEDRSVEAKETLDTDRVMSVVFRSSSEALVTLSNRKNQSSRFESFISRSRLLMLLCGDSSLMLFPMVGSLKSEEGSERKVLDRGTENVVPSLG